MTKLMTVTADAAVLWKPKGTITPKQAGEVVCSFLDTASTSMGRATHYNTREEQQAAELEAHAKLMSLDRDLYTALLTLPGVLYRAQQLGLKNLLGTPRNGVESFLTADQERLVLYHLIQSMEVPAMMRLFQALQVGDEKLGIKRANNNRTRKLILRTLLGSPRLQLWVVKYRRKVLAALKHAWGNRRVGVVRSILSKDGRTWTKGERKTVSQCIDRFKGENSEKYVRECVRFVLGDRDRLTLPMLKAFIASKDDLEVGAKARLPKEILYGIRSNHHMTVPKEDVLKMVAEAGGLTEKTKMQVQRQAKKAGIGVEFDPNRYDAVRLYLYAFEMGLDEAIVDALATKARQGAAKFPARYGKVGMVVDGSFSMSGDKTQPLRPMAVVLSLRDMLRETAGEAFVEYVGGAFETEGGDTLVRPSGDTALADGLVKVLTNEPDAVYVLSDGYENTPAGRFAEVMAHVRDLGIETPIYHLNPVFAAEATAVRSLCPEGVGVSTMPVKDPTALGVSFLRALIETDPLRGINSLVRLSLTGTPAERKVLA